MQIRTAWLALSQIPRTKPDQQRKIVEYFSDPLSAWRAGPRAWADIIGHRRHVERWHHYWQKQPGERLLERCRATNTEVIVWTDADYPTLLRETVNPPLVLYVQGNGSLCCECVPVAVVGTRHPDGYGIAMTRRFVRALAELPVNVISGLARGIDGIAHRTVCDVRGKTIAVLGCGVNVTYPAEHATLFEKIKEHNLIISEYPPDTPPYRANFPARNRIIAGLARVVVVIQAPRTSGALITTRFALDWNRDVCVVPADVTRVQSEGCLSLLQDGAFMIRNEEDLMDVLEPWLDGVRPLEQPNKQREEQLRKSLQLSPIERAVIEAVRTGVARFDELCTVTEMEPMDVNAAIMMLRLKGLLDVLPGPTYYART